MAGDEKRATWPSIIQALAAAAIPLAIALVGNCYSSAIKERDVQARFVELALTILQAPPDSSTRNLRSWAIRVVDQYSRVPLDSGVATDLRQAVTLPAPPGTGVIGGGASDIGLMPGTSVTVRVRLATRARLRWARLHTPQTKITLDREVGPGLDSFPLPFGSTIYLTVLPAGSSDSIVQKFDCTRGCTVEVP